MAFDTRPEKRAALAAAMRPFDKSALIQEVTLGMNTACDRSLR